MADKYTLWKQGVLLGSNIGGVDGATMQAFEQAPRRLEGAASITKIPQERAAAQQQAIARDIARVNGAAMQAKQQAGEAILARQAAAEAEALSRPGPTRARAAAMERASAEKARRFYADPTQWTPDALRARKEIPIVGMDPRYTSEYVDAWWGANKDLYPEGRAALEARIKGFKPAQRTITLPGGGYKFESEQDARNRLSLQSTAADDYDPVYNAQVRWYTRPVALSTVNEDLEDTARHAGAGQYVASKVLEHNLLAPVLNTPARILTGEDFSTWSTGLSQEQMLDRYAADLKKAGATDAQIQSWRRALKAGGHAAAAVEDAFQIWAAGKVAPNTFTSTLENFKATRPAADITQYAGDALRDSSNPYAQKAGEWLNRTGGMIQDMPYWEAAGTMLGIGANAVGNSKMVQGSPASQKTWNTTTAPWRYANGQSSATGVIGMLDNFGRAAVRDTLVAGPMFNAENEFIRSTTLRQPPDFTELVRLGPFGGMAYDFGEATGNFAGISDSARADNYQKKVQEAHTALAANPEAYAAEKGVPVEYVHDALDVDIAQQRAEARENEVWKRLDPNADWEHMTPEQREARLASFIPEQRANARFEAAKIDIGMGPGADTSILGDVELTPDQRKELLKDYIMQMDRAHAGRLGGKKVSQLFRSGFGLNTDFVTDLMDKDPDVREALVTYSQGKLADALAGKDDKMDRMSQAVLGHMTQDEVDRIMFEMVDDGNGGKLMTGAFADATPEQALNLLQGNGGELSKDPKVRIAYTRAIANRMANDGNFAADFVPGFVGSVEAGTGLDDAAKAECLAELTNIVNDPKKVFDTMDQQHFQKLGQFILSDEGQEKLAGLGEQGSALKAQWMQAAKDKAISIARKNPLTGIPMLAGLWAQSKGWNTAGSILGNSWGFWGIAALLLGSLVFGARALAGDDDDHESADIQIGRRKALSEFDARNQYGTAGM